MREVALPPSERAFAPLSEFFIVQRPYNTTFAMTSRPIALFMYGYCKSTIRHACSGILLELLMSLHFICSHIKLSNRTK